MRFSRILRTIRNRLPSGIKRSARYVQYGMQDFIACVTRSGDPLVPARRTVFIGHGDFKRIGDDGAYYGIEIVKSAVEWCNGAYRDFPNFKFIHADVYNAHYNPAGRVAVRDYKLPFDGETFDVVFLSSVFTHMWPGDVRHYLSEIARCLKPGRRCMATCFLLNEESRAAIRDNKAALAFRYEIDAECMTTTRDDPEDAIALDEQYLRAACAEAGLDVLDIRYGTWAPRVKAYGFQDMIIARRKVSS